MSEETIFSTSPGNIPQQFNVGVKRITGAQLLAAGKRKNWLYYITDIQACAVYENQGRNVWLGTNGVPVAGDSAIQASLIPVQGQRFYNLQTGPQEWKGTSWGAGSYAISNKLTPRIRLLEVAEPVLLSPEVEHYVLINDLVLTFPNDDYSVKGTSLDIYIGPDVTGTQLVVPAGWTLTTPGQSGVDTLPLNPNGIYKLVRTETTVVEMISTDNVDPVLRQSQNLADVPNKAIARANLDVFSKEEVGIVAGFLSSLDTGITISGNPLSILTDPSTGFYRISLSYETDPLAIINATPATAQRPVPAYTIKQSIDAAVEKAVGVSQYNNISGLSFDSTSFSFIRSANLISLDIGEASWLFNTDPYLRNQPITIRNMPAVNIPMALPATEAYHYITIGTVGDYVASNSYDANDFSKCLVGVVYSVASQIVWALPCPAIASSDMSLRTAPIASSGHLLKSMAGGQWLQAEAGFFNKEGIGWSQSQANPHYRSFSVTNNILFDIVNQDGTVFASQQQYVKGNQLSDGSSVAAGEYTVHIVYRMLNGRYLVIRPEAKYASKSAADTAIASVTFTKPAWMQGSIEVCRWVVKGDQFQGSGAYNLSVTTNFEAKTLNAIASSGAAGGGAGNWEVLAVTGGGTLQAGKIYMIQDANNYSFPVIGSAGQAFAAFSMPGFAPILTVQNYPTVFLRDMELQADDNSIQLTVPWVKEEFYSTGTYWGW